MSNFKKNLKIYQLFFILLFSLFGITVNVLAQYVWIEPTQNPPAGNIAPPLNQGATSQPKWGGLHIGSEEIMEGMDAYLFSVNNGESYFGDNLKVYGGADLIIDEGQLNITNVTDSIILSVHSSSGGSIAIKGYSSSGEVDSIGVRGEAGANGIGVYGKVTSVNAIGVAGKNTATNGLAGKFEGEVLITPLANCDVEGQVVQADENGVLFCGVGGGGAGGDDGDWTIDGNDIYRTSGQIGVGTSNYATDSKLTIQVSSDNDPAIAILNSDGSASGIEMRANKTDNIFIGRNSGMNTNASGDSNRNTALGVNALQYNYSDGDNTAVGYNSLRDNQGGGSGNVAVGSSALENNTTGILNVAIGTNTLDDAPHGDSNIAIGSFALGNDSFSSGINNIAIGTQAGNELIGNYPATGIGNILIGIDAQTPLDDSGDNYDLEKMNHRLNIGDIIYGEMDDNGKVGIETDDPDYTLDVQGKINASEEICINGSCISEWAEGGGDDGDWTIDGNNIYRTSGQIGIGTSNYATDSKLTIQVSSDNDPAIAILNSDGSASGIEMRTGGGTDNIFIGNDSGLSNNTGENNTALGSDALSTNTSGDNNIAIGASALGNIVTGGHNIGIGNVTGTSVLTTSYNILIGDEVDVPSPNGDYQLNIGNLIYGEMDDNGKVGIETDNPDYTLDVQGKINASEEICINGSCISEWAEGGGDDGDWTIDGNNIYRTSGQIGIGTSNYATDSKLIIQVSSDNDPAIAILNSDGSASGIEMRTGGGPNNIFIGPNSGLVNDYSSGGGIDNGSDNIALGSNTLSSNTTGWMNIALGPNALGSNTTGLSNIAMNNNALGSNTTGVFNIAIGHYALSNSINSDSNIAIGSLALQNHVSGMGNVAIGNSALSSQETGTNNIAIGENAGVDTEGTNNIAIGAGVSVYSSDGSGYRLNIGNLIYGNMSDNVASSDGRVGIEKNYPDYTLDVNGDINASGQICIDDDCITGWAEGGAGSAYWDIESDNDISNTNSSGDIDLAGNLKRGNKNLLWCNGNCPPLDTLSTGATGVPD